MHELGDIDARRLAAASARPVTVHPGPGSPNGCIDATAGGFFCAYLEQYLQQQLGISRDMLDNGGLTIQTTPRPDVQGAGDQAVVAALPLGRPLGGTVTAGETRTRAVRGVSV